MRFDQWLGALLNQNPQETRRLLDNPAAQEFLIAWSLFESKCFDGYVKIDRIESFAQRIIEEGADACSPGDALIHFHQRYQDNERYRQLMHGQSSPKMEALVGKPIESFQGWERFFFLAVVAYRFRNNMFHGNKGVPSWLNYAKQIQLCTTTIAHCISHAEHKRPSLPERQVA
jgi:hypothetical protein